jgi:transcriptional regulator with XRE-family HTH domain
MTPFAALLRDARLKAGLSAYALARRSGITPQSMSALEAGKSAPTWETVQRVAQALGVDYSAFADPDLTVPGEAAAPRPVGRPKKVKPAKEGERRGRRKGPTKK